MNELIPADEMLQEVAHVGFWRAFGVISQHAHASGGVKSAGRCPCPACETGIVTYDFGPATFGIGQCSTPGCLAWGQ